MRQRAIADTNSRPVLPRHARLHFDKVRQNWALLTPEKVLWPDEISLAILRKCDGERSISQIAGELAQEFEAEAEEVQADILVFAQDWSDRMVLKL